MSFETRPVREVTQNSKRPGSAQPVLAAFGELPEGLALFVERGGAASIEYRRTSTRASLRSAFPHRKISTAIDRDKDGVWFWWEPKP